MNKKEILKHYFEDQARQGDGDYMAKGSLPDRAQRKSRGTVVDWLIDKQVKSVTDLGCGPGDLLHELGMRDKTIKLIGVDMSPEMIKAAQKRTRRSLFHCADITDLTGVNKSDAVVCLNTLHHLNKRELNKTLKEMGRVARKVIIIEIKNPTSLSAPAMWFDLKFNKRIPVYLHNPTYVARVLRRLGWKLDREQLIFGWPIISPFGLYAFKK